MIKENYMLGGKQLGCIILLDPNTTGDRLVTALQIAVILKENSKAFSELVGVINGL